MNKKGNSKIKKHAGATSAKYASKSPAEKQNETSKNKTFPIT